MSCSSAASRSGHAVCARAPRPSSPRSSSDGERQAGEVVGAERVLEAGVGGAGIDQEGVAELADVAQALHRRACPARASAAASSRMLSQSGSRTTSKSLVVSPRLRLVGQPPVLRRAPQARQDQLAHEHELLGHPVVQPLEQLLVAEDLLLPRLGVDTDISSRKVSAVKPSRPFQSRSS